MSAKRAASVGQFDLFGSLDGSSQDTDSAFASVFDIPVPDEHWSSKHQLTLEREMLGLYVSDHPLNGVEALLAAKTDTGIPAILEGDVADGAQVTVGGILASVNRRINKNGEPWASAQLEDLAGGIEVLFFPRTYTVVGTDVAEDAIVLIKARVSLRDDRVSLIVNDLAVPVLTAASPQARPPGRPHSGPSAPSAPISSGPISSGPISTGPISTAPISTAPAAPEAAAPEAAVQLSMLEEHYTPDRVAKLKELLGRHPGRHEVHLRLRSGTSSRVVTLAEGPWISPNSVLASELKALLGPNCLA
jgi:DNA polymerase-3 subunit alpha